MDTPTDAIAEASTQAQHRKKTHMEEQKSIIECLQEQLNEEMMANQSLHRENQNLHKENQSLHTEILVLNNRLETCRYKFTQVTFEKYEQISRNRHLASIYETTEVNMSQMSSKLDQLYTDSLALLEKIQGKPAQTGNVSSEKNAPNSDDLIISMKFEEQLRGSQENAESLNEESIAEQDHRVLFSELEDIDGASNKISYQGKKFRHKELEDLTQKITGAREGMEQIKTMFRELIDGFESDIRIIFDEFGKIPAEHSNTYETEQLKRDLEDLGSKHNQLLERTTQERRCLKEQIGELEIGQRTLQDQNDYLSDEVLKLMVSNTVLEIKEASMIEENVALIGMIDEIQYQKEQNKEENSELKTEMGKLKQLLDRTAEEKCCLQLRLQELEEQEETFKEQLEVAKKTIVEKNTNILDLRREMEDNADNLAKHQDLNDELKSKESVLVEKIKSLSSENAYLNSQIQGAQNALHEKDELIATHEHKLTESETCVEELKEKLKHFQQTIEQQQQQLDGMLEEQIFKGVEDETPTSSGEKVNPASDLLAEMNKLHTEQDVLRNANTSLSTEVVELKAENVNLLSQNAHEIDRVKELNAAVDSLQDEIGNLMLSFREKYCIIYDQDNEICSLKRKIQEFSSELDNSKKDEADSESESIFSYLLGAVKTGATCVGGLVFSVGIGYMANFMLPGFGFPNPSYF